MPDLDDTTAASDASGQDDWLLDASDDVIDSDDNAADKPNEDAPVDDKSVVGDKDADQPADAGKGEPVRPENPEAEDPNKEKPVAEDKGNQDDVAEQKRHNDEMAKKRIQDKQSQRQALQDAANQFVQNAQEKVEEAGDDETKRELAELKAKDAAREAREFVRDVETSQSVMQNDHSRAAREIPMFRELNDDGTPNSDFNQKAYDKALEHLAPHLQTQEMVDQQGKKQLVILGSNVPIYDFLKSEADSLTELLGAERTKGELQGQEAEQKMRGASEPGTGSTPPAPSVGEKEESEMRDAFASV